MRSLICVAALCVAFCTSAPVEAQTLPVTIEYTLSGTFHTGIFFPLPDGGASFPVPMGSQVVDGDQWMYSAGGTGKVVPAGKLIVRWEQVGSQAHGTILGSDIFDVTDDSFTIQFRDNPGADLIKTTRVITTNRNLLQGDLGVAFFTSPGVEHVAGGTNSDNQPFDTLYLRYDGLTSPVCCGQFYSGANLAGGDLLFLQIEAATARWDASGTFPADPGDPDAARAQGLASFHGPHNFDQINSQIRVTLSGTGVVAETGPPPFPVNLTAAEITVRLLANEAEIDLFWDAVVDPEGSDPVTYSVFRGGVTVATGLTSPMFTDSGLPQAAFNYTVTATDLVGNESTLSDVLAVDASCVPEPPDPLLPFFVRGNPNGGAGGGLGHPDVTAVCNFLTQGTPLPCADAADMDDDGDVDTVDLVTLINLLDGNGGNSLLPPQLGGCVQDVTPDALDCVTPGTFCD